MKRTMKELLVLIALALGLVAMARQIKALD